MSMSMPRTNKDRGLASALDGDVEIVRGRTQQTAQQLSLAALRQWEKAITGVMAVPVAIGLTASASVMFASALLERGFEVFDSAVSDIGRRMDRDARADGSAMPPS